MKDRFDGPGLKLLRELQDHERRGVPKDAGTDTAAGFDLSRMHTLLDSMGNPHKKFKAVHVTGTKGKGSTSAFLASILRVAGYRTCCYSSPHVVSLGERITVDGAPISCAELEARLAAAEPAIRELIPAGLSHFEVLTALAFDHFARQCADVAVVEVGLGGARDATNVFDTETLVAAVVAPIGREHLEALGGSLRSVAQAKAGIMKPGITTVLGAQPEQEARDVLLDHGTTSVRDAKIYRAAEALGAPILEAGDQISLAQVAGKDSHAGVLATILGPSVADAFGLAVGDSIDLPPLGLEGPHQLQNAATAVTAAAVLRNTGGFERVTLEAVKEGLRDAWLPGRFQRCRLPGPDNKDDDVLVVLDGAHTPEAARFLVQSVRQAVPDGCPVALILGVAADKDLNGLCEALGVLRPVVTLPIEVEISGARARAAPPGTIMAAWTFSVPRPGRVMIQPSLLAALERAKMELRAVPRSLGAGTPGRPRGIVLITGSMHVVGAALRGLDLESVHNAQAVHR